MEFAWDPNLDYADLNQKEKWETRIRIKTFRIRNTDRIPKVCWQKEKRILTWRRFDTRPVPRPCRTTLCPASSPPPPSPVQQSGEQLFKIIRHPKYRAWTFLVTKIVSNSHTQCLCICQFSIAPTSYCSNNEFWGIISSNMNWLMSGSGTLNWMFFRNTHTYSIYR